MDVGWIRELGTNSRGPVDEKRADGLRVEGDEEDRGLCDKRCTGSERAVENECEG